MKNKITEAAKGLKKFADKSQQIATVESCTGGMVAESITAISGSSRYFHSGIVVYSNQAKTALANVSENIISEYGAVSEQTAKAMAIGYLEKSGVDIVVSITGVAGPDGGTLEKPVGLVCFAIASRSKNSSKKSIKTFKQHFKGDRDSIREQATIFALELFIHIST